MTNRPFEAHHWAKDFKKDASEWLASIDDNNFLRELFPETEPDWIVVDEYIITQSEHWEVTSKINSGLVSPDTALSLVRALQTCPNDTNFYVCPEGDDQEIDEAAFQLKGWVRLHEGGGRFDEKDPFQIGVGRPSHSPGSSAIEFFDLQEVLEDGLRWIDPTTGYPIFRFEIWGDKGAAEQYRHLGDRVVGSGHRLLVARSALYDFLQDRRLDLIADIGITKRDKSQGKQSIYQETKREATFERILLLQRSGEIEGAEQSFGSWRTDRT